MNERIVIYMKKIKIKINNEKGSATLYVLVAMLLILVVMLTIYMRIRNKNNIQLQQLSKIQEEYQSDNIDDIYKKIEANSQGKISVIFYLPNGKEYNLNEWTNQNLSMKITYPSNVQEDNKYYYLNGEKTKYTDNEIITENCEISLEYGGQKESISITKIDKNLPTVEIDENYKKTWTNENILLTGRTTDIDSRSTILSI